MHSLAQKKGLMIIKTNHHYKQKFSPQFNIAFYIRACQIRYIFGTNITHIFINLYLIATFAVLFVLDFIPVTTSSISTEKYVRKNPTQKDVLHFYYC